MQISKNYHFGTHLPYPFYSIDRNNKPWFGFLCKYNKPLTWKSCNNIVLDIGIWHSNCRIFIGTNDRIKKIK